MIFNILDNTTELWMTKYVIGENFSSGGATLCKNPSDQTVICIILLGKLVDYPRNSITLYLKAVVPRLSRRFDVNWEF